MSRRGMDTAVKCEADHLQQLQPAWGAGGEHDALAAQGLHVGQDPLEEWMISERLPHTALPSFSGLLPTRGAFSL